MLFAHMYNILNMVNLCYILGILDASDIQDIIIDIMYLLDIINWFMLSLSHKNFSE